MKPLLSETEDALERKLLEEARDYKASDTARAAALAIVGTGKPSFLKSAGFKVALGVVAIAALGLLANGGAVLRGWSGSSDADVTVAPPTIVTVETTAVARPTITTTAIPPADLALPSPAITQALPAVKPAPIAQNSAKSTLSEEIAVIDRARSAVYSKDRDGAIRALDEYERRFPKGSFAPEAKTLRERAGSL